MGTPEPVLGIDLGTSYSTAAVVAGGRLHFALDGRGEPCFPSVVHFPKSGPPLVGVDADKMRGSDPENTVFGIKRIIGRSADSGPGRILNQCAAFKIRAAGKGEAVVSVNGGDRTASQVGALIVAHLKERAEARFQRKFTKVVMTVPVMAGPEVRDAMVRLGKTAGLEVIRIISEPCAGALSRGRVSTSGRPLVVFDFGGGTFDATVVQYTQGGMKVLASGGDECLGGDDFDLAFARWVGDGIFRAHKKDVTHDVVLWDRIMRTCERVKRALSGSPETRFTVKDAFVAGGQEQSIDTAVRREHLTPVWEELVRRSIESTRATITEARLADPPSAVLMIGGTTFVPQVREAVAQSFQYECLVENDAQTAVARGAALLAAHPELLAE